MSEGACDRGRVEGPREYFPDHAASGSSHENLCAHLKGLSRFHDYPPSEFALPAASSQWLQRSSIYHPDRATTHQFLNPGNKTAVWTNIISFRFHHHHEVAGTFHVKQHLGLAFTLIANGMQRVDSGFRGGIQRHADAYRTRQFWLRFFQRLQPSDDDLGTLAFFTCRLARTNMGIPA